MKIYSSVFETVGNTPLIELSRLTAALSLPARILAKVESFNPAGSAKDRVALNMILAAEREGRLVPGGTIIEPTSGNTGIGLAALGVCRGYRVIVVLPDNASVERRRLIAAYGAEVILTDGKDGMRGAVSKAEELAKNIENSFIPSQFENPENPAAHYNTTGPEIWRDTEGKADVFVCGIGTGGTVSGTGRYLKERKPDLSVIGVEPADSPLLTEGKAGPHALQGIGANFIPATLDISVCDEVLTATTEESFASARLLAKTEGLLCGISSGAALSAAIRVAKREENRDKVIVVLLPDTGERYLSTELFE